MQKLKLWNFSTHFMQSKSNILLLITIVALAAFLRLYKLDSFPVSLSWDEAAIGYNAYSITQTGADEYGKPWPLLFKSFNDYKLPGYIYLDAVFIKFFGLSEFTTRLPSAILGVLAVPLIYFLARAIFQMAHPRGVTELRGVPQVAHLRGEIKTTPRPHLEGVIAALLLAISPWSLQLSRAAFEANAGLTVFLAGALLLVYGLKNRLAAIASLPVLTLSIYFYYSQRILVPALILVFFIIFRRYTANLKYFVLSLSIAAVILIPITTQTLTQSGLKRISEVSIFKDQALITDYVQAASQDQSILGKVFLNRRVPLIIESLHNYFAHFSFGFLFFGDDPNTRHHTSFHGNFYIFEIPLILLGIFALIKLPNRQIKYFLLAWLMLAPLPAAFSQEAPHSLRSLLMLPPLVIISAMGLVALAGSKVRQAILALVVIFFFINYLYSYYGVYPIKNNLNWAYGYKQMYQQIASREDQYDRIVVTGYYWKPYIFYLFANWIDPSLTQSSTQESIGKYRFGTTGWDSGGQDLNEIQIENLKLGKTLVVLSPGELANIKNKDNFQRVATINDYSGRQAVFEIEEWK